MDAKLAGFENSWSRKWQKHFESLAFVKKRISSVNESAFPFISVSGQSARNVAEQTLQLLGKENESAFKDWKLLDEETADEILKNPKTAEILENFQTEEFRGGMKRLFEKILSSGCGENQETKKRFVLIRIAASFGKVILIESPAPVTRDLSLGIHARLAGEKGGTQKTDFFPKCFNRNIDDPLLYDFIVNADKMPATSVASLLIYSARLAWKSKAAAALFKI